MDFENIVSLMIEKGYIPKESEKTILEDKDFQKKRKERKKKTSEERQGIYDVDKCQARVWLEGYDNIQCSFSKFEKGCLCKKHQTCSDKSDGWWLGFIKEPRPENLLWRGVEHFWRVDGDGNELVKTEKKTIEEKSESPPENKKKRGRPKGSKNKKKVEEKKELTIKETITLLELKIKEKEKEQVDKEQVDNEPVDKEQVEEVLVKDDSGCIYMVDGVPYEIKEGEIMDPEDYSPMGVSDGKGGIDFEDEDALEKHHENIQNYKEKEVIQ